MPTISINGQEIEVRRARLRLWLALDDLLGKIYETKDIEEKIKYILKYLSMMINVIEWESLPWYDVVRCFSSVVTINKIGVDFPILEKKKKNEKKEAWYYDGRSWYEWANLLAKKYAWTLEYISELDITDAMGLMQEIMLDEQLQKEWEWGLSEKSVSYDARSKVSRFNALLRPGWMLPKIEIKKIKIHKSLLPVGIVVDLSGLVDFNASKPS